MNHMTNEKWYTTNTQACEGERSSVRSEEKKNRIGGALDTRDSWYTSNEKKNE